MHITFVALGSEQLAISLLAPLLERAGHKVSLAYNPSYFLDRYNLNLPSLGRVFDQTHDVKESIRENQPDVLAFSPLTSTVQWCLEIARWARGVNPNIKTVFGGPHASAVPEVLLNEEGVDYVCVGEGEEAFLKLLDHLAGKWEGPLPNIYFKDKQRRVIRGPLPGFIQDLDSLPFFDKKLWADHIRVGDLYLTMAARGCPFRCTFCFNNFFAEIPEGKKGRYLRLRSPEHMIAELKLAKNLYSLKVVAFEDDIFTTDKVWLKKFLELYRREFNLPFQCLTHPQFMDLETARMLKESGCQWIQMGVQTVLEEQNKKMKRRESLNQVERSLDAMISAGLSPKIDHMFGLPGEPLSAQSKALEVYSKYTPGRIQTFWTSFLPGTELTSQGLKEGILSREDFDLLNRGLKVDFHAEGLIIKDEDKLQIYKRYDFLFKLLPLIPKEMRRVPNIRILTFFPAIILSLIGQAVDFIHGLIAANPEHRAYFWTYFFGLAKFFKKRFKLSLSMKRKSPSAKSSLIPK